VPIVPLPQFEADVAELERERLVASLRGKGHDPEQLASLTADELETLDRKKKPGTLVVRYGRMKMIGEFPYRGHDARAAARSWSCARTGAPRSARC
jgi:hypothetical protein